MTLRQRIIKIENSISKTILDIFKKESSYEFLTKRAIEAIKTGDLNLAVMLLILAIENKENGNV